MADLYGVAPDAFISRRRALVAQAVADGDKELARTVSELRKPSVSAWAINHWTRRHPEDLSRLRQLGEALRDAQDRMDGTALKELGRERSGLLDQIGPSVAQAAEGENQPLSAGAAREVHETLTAALATTEAMAAVASARLTRALSYAGFGDVDLTEATATPSGRPGLHLVRSPEGAKAERRSRGGPRAAERPPEPPGPEPALLEGLRQAEERARQAMADATEAGTQLSEAAAAFDAAEARLSDLERQVKDARAEREKLREERARTERHTRTTERAVRAALSELDDARAALGTDEP